MKYKIYQGIHHISRRLPSADHLAILGGIHAEVKPIFVFKNARQGDAMGGKNKWRISFKCRIFRTRNVTQEETQAQRVRNIIVHVYIENKRKAWCFENNHN